MKAFVALATDYELNKQRQVWETAIFLNYNFLDFLGDDEGIDRMLKEIKVDDSIKKDWKEKMLQYDTTVDRWAILQQQAKQECSK